MNKKIDSKYIEKLYDNIASKQYKGDYDKNRWAVKSEKSRYNAMFNTIKEKSKNTFFKKYIELGPGPGTWTKLFLENNPNAEFDLIDISSEMLKQAKNNLQKYPNKINYIKKDFLTFKTNKKYDFFFSSRAIEYLSDKEKAFEKIGNIIENKGKGIIITKTPHPIKDKIYEKIGRKIKSEHKDQISMKKMKVLLEKNGFKDIKIRHLIIEFPPSVRYNKPGINKKLYKIFKNRKICFFTKPFSEAYIAEFVKK